MIRKWFLIILFLTSFVGAVENNSGIDRYRDDVSRWLIDTSSSIDNYFFDETNESLRNKTYAKLVSSFAIEERNGNKIEYDVRLKLRLNLPRVQKHLRLVFEDDDDGNDDQTSLGDNHQLSEKDYHLRVEYVDYVVKRFKFGMGTGIRLRNLLIYPYLNFKTKYTIHDTNKYQSAFLNRLRWYVNGDVENIFEYNFVNNINSIDKTLYFNWYNKLTYMNTEDMEDLLNGVALIKIFDKKTRSSVGFSLLSKMYNFKITNLDYAQYYVTHQKTFYKDWMYYKVTPSMLWRKVNDYRCSYRFMVNIGMIFK